MGLREFLAEDRRRLVFISRRLKDEKGRSFGFLIKSLNENDLEEIRAGSEMDFVFQVIKKGCIFPKFKEDCNIETAFLPGEAYRLYYEIVKLGGLDLTMAEMRKQVGGMLLRGEAEAVYCCLAAFEMGIKPREFVRLDRKEKACIEAFIDEKLRLKNKRK